MKKKLVITIIGNVGSGKTTLSSILEKSLDVKLLRADELFQTVNPFREVFLADISRWGLANELWLVYERVKLMRQHLERYPKDISLVDSGVLMSWVYMHSHYSTHKITKLEWDLYKNFYNELTEELPNNMVVIDLRYSYQTLMKRIKKRGRDYEIRQYNDYVKHLEKGLDALRKKLKERGVTVLGISEKQIPEFEESKKHADLIVKRVKKQLMKK